MKNEAKVIAAAFSLLGFAVALISGMSAGNPASLVLPRALLVMIMCQVVGAFAGAVMSRIVDDHVRAYEAARPVPDMSLAPVASAASGDEKISQNLSQRR